MTTVYEMHKLRKRVVGFLISFLFQPPQDSERVATFAEVDESALFHRFDGIAISGQGAYFFIVIQAPQNWVAPERISLKLVSVLDVRKQVLFDLSESRLEATSFLLRHSSRPPGAKTPARRSALQKVGHSKLRATLDPVKTTGSPSSP